MTEALFVNVTLDQIRSALVVDGVVQEIHVERLSRSRQFLGNIYKGKVVRVMPGMKAAFLDIGLSRTGYLQEADMVHPSSSVSAKYSAKKMPINGSGGIREGQQLLVQIARMPKGSKGARLTTELSIAGRYLVYMPRSEQVGISHKIADGIERDRLKQAIEALLIEQNISGGLIVRTAAEGVDRDSLSRDLAYLQGVWLKIQELGREQSAPKLMHSDPPLHIRLVRDLAGRQVKKIHVDSVQHLQEMQSFSALYCPELLADLTLYQEAKPIFDCFDIEQELRQALLPNVALSCGGSIVIEQTEAMVTVDVNTGTFVGTTNFDETALKTNLQAAETIARQLRLRNLGGLVLIDFIDMQSSDKRQQVLAHLDQLLKADPAKTTLSKITDFGLLQMTRERTHESLVQALCEPCPECLGRAVVKSPESISFEVYRQIMQENRYLEASRILVIASEKVVEQMSGLRLNKLTDPEGKNIPSIEFKVDNSLRQEQYDIIAL